MEADIASRRYPQTIRARVPAGLPQAIEIAARAQLTSPAEYCRRALLAALGSDGVNLDGNGRISIAAATQPRLQTRSRPEWVSTATRCAS
jgi:hypothetical protein